MLCTHTHIRTVQAYNVRCRTDLGTGDEVGLDILVNTLQGCSEEYVGIKQLIIGGVNEDWPVADALTPEVRFVLALQCVDICVKRYSDFSAQKESARALPCCMVEPRAEVVMAQHASSPRGLVQVAMNPMKGGGQEDVPEDDDAEDHAEDMDELLEQIRRDHPDKFEKLQRLQSQMNDLDL